MLRALRFLVALWFSLALTATPVEAASPGRLLVTGGGATSWVLPPARNGVDLNFAKGLYWTKGATGPLANGRATNETCWTSTGNLVQVGPYQNCVTDLGVEAQEGRTNSLPNSTMAGAVVGTPGTIPNGWTNWGNVFGITQSIPATPIVNGVQAINIRLNGTTTAYAPYNAEMMPYNVANAAYGQTWTGSVTSAIAGGSLSNINPYALYLFMYNSTGTYLGGVSVSMNSVSVTPKRYSVSYTIPFAAAAYIQLAEQVNIPSSGLAVDFTQQLIAPQLELNPNIPASVASATIAAGGSGGTNGACVLTVQGGSGTAATLNGTIASGALSAIGSVASAGSYAATSGLPASPASVTGCGLSGATVNLVPVDNSAQAFATPPILTTNGALARSPDSITMPLAACPNPSLYVVGTPAAPTGYAVQQMAAQVDDGTTSNYVQIFRNTGSGSAGTAVSGTYAGTSGTSWAANTQAKVTSARTTATLSSRFNGASANSVASVGTVTGSMVRIGFSFNGGSPFNGTISRVAVSCGQSLLNQ